MFMQVDVAAHVEFEMGVRNRRGGTSTRFRHLSPSIVPKRNYLAVDLTVSSLYAGRKSKSFMVLISAGDN